MTTAPMPPKSTAPTAPQSGVAREAQRSMQKAGEALSWTAGFIALPWLKVKGQAQVDEKEQSYSIAADGTLKVNPTWYAAQRPDERVFELAASMMTFLMRHHDRGVALGVVDPATGGPIEGQENNHKLWNRARAMVVNAPLKADAIGRAPADALFPPGDYKGSLDAESLYNYLLKNEPPPPPGGGQSPQGGGGGQQPQQGNSPPAPPHAGGSVQPPQGKGSSGGDDQAAPGSGQGQQQGGQGGLSPDDIDQIRRDVEALARQAGIGTHCVEALKPKVARTNYRAVIGAGLDTASTEASERTRTTYSRASRREAFIPEVILPGKIGEDPSICVVIDFSGSTSFYAQKFVDHAQKIATDYPTVRVLLVAHTDRVVYQSWLKPGGDAAKLEAASKFSGGTDFAPAYDAARVEAKKLAGGKFDALCHFTDGFNFRDWPLPPSRRLIVGLCGDSNVEGITPLPMPAKVIPVTTGD